MDGPWGDVIVDVEVLVSYMPNVSVQFFMLIFLCMCECICVLPQCCMTCLTPSPRSGRRSSWSCWWSSAREPCRESAATGTTKTTGGSRDDSMVGGAFRPVSLSLCPVILRHSIVWWLSVLDRNLFLFLHLNDILIDLSLPLCSVEKNSQMILWRNFRSTLELIRVLNAKFFSTGPFKSKIISNIIR